MDSSHSWRSRDKVQLSRQSDINPNRVAIDPITPITVYSITGTRGNETGRGKIVTITAIGAIHEIWSVVERVLILGTESADTWYGTEREAIVAMIRLIIRYKVVSCRGY